MKNITILCILLLGIKLSTGQNSTPVKLYNDKSKSTIAYKMNHLLHSWEGVSKEVNSVIVTNEDKSLIAQVAVTAKISSFDSRNANRDSHTMEVTGALKYPSVSFASSSVVQNGNELDVTGILTFHGVSRSISFKATPKKVKNALEVTGEFEINMTDYKIDPPSLMGVATDEVIKLSFDVFY